MSAAYTRQQVNSTNDYSLSTFNLAGIIFNRIKFEMHNFMNQKITSASKAGKQHDLSYEMSGLQRCEITRSNIN